MKVVTDAVSLFLRDGAEVTSTGRSFHMRAPASGDNEGATSNIGCLTAGTSRSSDEEDRRLCRDGTSAIGVNCCRYCGAPPWRGNIMDALVSLH